MEAVACIAASTGQTVVDVKWRPGKEVCVAEAYCTGGEAGGDAGGDD